MEALRDRTIKIDIPYITKLTEEIRIYEKDFNPTKIKGKHIAPHTLEVAAMWAALTRLEDPKKHNLSLLQKLKLYDGKVLPGYTQDTVKELRKESKREGNGGDLAPLRSGQDLERARQRGRRRDDQPLHGAKRLEKGLRHHSLITSEEMRKRFAEGDWDRQARIRGDREERGAACDQRRRDAISKLAANYIDNIKAFTSRRR